MKITHKTSFLFMLAAIFFMTTSCTKQDEPETERPLTVNELPAKASSYLAYLFPNQQPLMVEKASGADTTHYHFRATYADQLSLDFTEQGNWMYIQIPNGTAPQELVKRFQEIYNYTARVSPSNTLTELTQTDYGVFATLNNGQRLAFAFDNQFIGNELGIEGYNVLPNKIQQLVSQHFSAANYSAIIECAPTSQPPVYAYQIWLSNQCAIGVSPQGEWIDIDGHGQALPSTLIGILPKRIQQKLKEVTSIYHIRIRKEGKTYEIGDSPRSSILINTEERPPINLNPEEIQSFINSYFGSGSNKSIITPMDDEAPLQYTVQLLNGFDFILGPEQLQWSEVDGHGYPFLPMQQKLLPESALRYIADHSPAHVTTARRSTEGYLLILTDGTAYRFAPTGSFVAQEHVTPTPYERCYTYMRYHYPNLYSCFSSWTPNVGWTFSLPDGTRVQFDPQGNLL